MLPPTHYKPYTTPTTAAYSTTQNNGPPNSPAFRTQAGIPGTCLLYHKDTLTEPTAAIKEHLMGFQPGTTAAPGLTERDKG